MRRGVAPVLVISGGFEPKYRLAHPYCGGGAHPGFRVICFDPHPNSTRGEAEETARLARAHGWKRLVVVSSTYHLFRARLLFRRCTDARIDVVGWDPPLHRWALSVLSEWVKLGYSATFHRSC